MIVWMCWRELVERVLEVLIRGEFFCFMWVGYIWVIYVEELVSIFDWGGLDVEG